MTELARFAVTETNSRGRAHPVQLAKDRNAFQRDYTRILHSRAFRRLQGKTQVFPAEQGEIGSTYRTRMSHSFEVEQIARSAARMLGLNQDLCAALAIGHDIGHAPFGHTGQDVLNSLFRASGGFEHNHQALRIVDTLESPYPGHPGMNLMFETRAGLLKHCSRARAETLGAVAARHITGAPPCLEAQLVGAADRIAYLHGDLEDAVDQGLFAPEFLMDEMPGFKSTWQDVVKAFPGSKLPSLNDLTGRNSAVGAKALLGEVWRRLLSSSLSDLVVQSRSNISVEKISCLDDVLNTRPLIGFSEDIERLNTDIRRFSRRYIYENSQIQAWRDNERAALEAMAMAVTSDPGRWNVDDNPRAVLDFLASLTDRAVLQWHACQLNPAAAPAAGRDGP